VVCFIPQLGSLALDTLRRGKLMNKLIIGIGTFGGSTLASYIPALWGGGMLTSILFSVLGGTVGVLLAYRLGKAMDLL
jgi:hypothetical protein